MEPKRLLRWLPALALMAVIFWLSSQPDTALPDFGALDILVKKGAHFTGYALLALSYAFALGPNSGRSIFLSFILTLLYAVTDEIHQSFVPGRHASIWDIALDISGALLALTLLTRPKRNPVP